MPLMCEGVYIDAREDKPYEVATTYQLGFYISSALISLDYIFCPLKDMVDKHANEPQYYRYYVDNLFYYLGLINERFVVKNGGRDEDVREKKQERIEANRKNYHFTEEDYPILANKDPRNIIEHLDERNVKTIIQNLGAGGFNVISSKSDPDMVKSINEHREYYPYNLDLVNNKVMFYNVQASPNKAVEFEIDLNGLKDELERLKESVEWFANFVMCC